jgi:hypothetical protein
MFALPTAIYTHGPGLRGRLLNYFEQLGFLMISSAHKFCQQALPQIAL